MIGRCTHSNAHHHSTGRHYEQQCASGRERVVRAILHHGNGISLAGKGRDSQAIELIGEWRPAQMRPSGSAEVTYVRKFSAWPELYQLPRISWHRWADIYTQNPRTFSQSDTLLTRVVDAGAPRPNPGAGRLLTVFTILYSRVGL
ncbi:uncharacterized protein MYCFIDRAFT_176198 [Pseudocercospora fijiensis CIRAD86]|uniref:Uncharacterized protein n=1 Tax=Pseudocercospora fijiensis (strain CIRAD86) TaxID=383855 RepID=M3ATL7_PSEFD|nr:uncharacterized protein MYCFIDRAFT_176198 [Pseudocercospora fijiensis CIRAD86]EME80812.1 hypothetical protein MYCFIDRAFT_176198 [Pseudocercospora fijiensis CIRAD86]